MSVRMRTNCSLSIALRVGQLVVSERHIAHVLVLGAAIFALVLFSLSLYAWRRTRQAGLALVSAAFLLFFLERIFLFLSTIYEFRSSVELLLLLMHFIILALFFMAIVPRPRKQLDQNH
jgi:heme A synthase